MVERVSGKYGLLLVVDIQDPCLLLDLTTTNATVPVGASYSARTSNNAKGIVSLELTGGTSFSMGSETELDLTRESLFSNGLKLSYSVTDLSTTITINGVMNVTNSTEESGDLEIPNGYGVRRLGISDFRRIEQTLCCYVPGEVAHIENVMAREYKERSTRRLRRSEDTVTSTSSSESENMSDTSTTSRFDMQSEVSKVLSESTDKSRSASFNSSTSGSTSVPLVGDVDFSLGFDFSTSTSSELSENQSTSFAKDVTEKALQRMTRKVSEERTSKIIEEFEEKNQHGFDNRKGAEHISGVFRWGDKIYKNEIHNYGKRLQYEFMVPQLAAFHLIAKAASANSNNDFPLNKPIDPKTNSFGSLDAIPNSAHVKPSNYS